MGFLSAAAIGIGTMIAAGSFVLSGLAKEPDFIGVDAGSTDDGPHSLGSREPVRGVRRDLELLLRGISDTDVPDGDCRRTRADTDGP